MSHLGGDEDATSHRETATAKSKPMTKHHEDAIINSDNDVDG